MNNRTFTHQKVCAILLFSLGMLIMSCVKNPIPPAGDPVISERGKQAMRELITVLQAASAVNDAQGIVHEFPFNQSLLDSIYPRISLWDPAQSASLVLPTLGKRTAASATLFTQLQSSVAATQGTSTPRKMAAINPALLHLDSLLAVGDTPLIRIRLSLDSLSIPSPYDSGCDSIYGYWDTTGGIHARLDSMIRFLVIDSATPIITRQHWEYISQGNELNLLDLSQQQLSNGATRYFHRAKLAGTTIQDTLFSGGINGSMAMSITRVDSSVSFFSSLDSCRLSDFTLDSIANNKLQKRTTLIGSGSYTFNLTSAQSIVTKATFYTPIPSIVTSEVTIHQTLIPTSPTTLDTFAQMDAYLLKDTIRYQIASPESALCTLSIAAKYGSSKPAFLGNIASSAFIFYLQHSPDFSSWKYTSFKRTDLIPDNSNPVQSVAWQVAPQHPADLSDLGKRPAGYVSATATYKFLEKTKKRFWSLCDSSVVDTINYSWVNQTGDSLSMKSLKDASGSFTYAIAGTGSTLRRGALTPAGSLFALSDTLFIGGSPWIPARIIAANLSSTGNGIMQTFGDCPSTDTISDTAIHFSFPSDPRIRIDNIALKRQGTSLSQTWISALDRDTIDYRISWDNAQLMGASLHTRSANVLKPRVDTLTILPTYNSLAASNYVYGVVENISLPDSMSATLSLDLWNTSYLQGITIK